jgi:hypothetical protein
MNLHFQTGIGCVENFMLHQKAGAETNDWSKSAQLR